MSLPAMRHALKILAKFLVSLILMTIVCTVAWELVNERVYDCTDAFGFDYWQPGNWVHRNVAVVRQVVHHRSMSEPDTIKEGWSVAGLWRLWYSFAASSVVASVLLAFLPWIRRRCRPSPTNKPPADNGAVSTLFHALRFQPAVPEKL